MCGLGTIIYIVIGFIGEGEKIEAQIREMDILSPVGFGPAACSSFRTKSGSRTKSGRLQFIPDAVRNVRETLGFMSHEIRPFPDAVRNDR